MKNAIVYLMTAVIWLAGQALLFEVYYQTRGDELAQAVVIVANVFYLLVAAPIYELVYDFVVVQRRA
jgi:uncharacterized membrane protein